MSVQKKSTGDVAPSSAGYESSEQSANASASAGLNLNVFGAVSGLFSSKSNKETGADGQVTEEKEEQAAIKGAGGGNLNAAAAANAEQKAKHERAQIQGK